MIEKSVYEFLIKLIETCTIVRAVVLDENEVSIIYNVESTHIHAHEQPELNVKVTL